MDPASLRRHVYLLLIVGAVAAVTGRVASLQETKLRNVELSPTHGSNDRSRWATVRALVDNETYIVGRRIRDPKTGKYDDSGIVFEEGWKTVDKVLDPEPAQENVYNFYSSKPPLFPTLVAGEYWLLKQLGLSITSDLSWVVRIVLLTFNVLPFAIYLLLLSQLAEAYGVTDWGRYFMIFAAGFATFLSTFSNTLNNHTVATCLALFALVSFLRIWNSPRSAAVGEEKAMPAAPPAEAPATSTEPNASSVAGEPAASEPVADAPAESAGEPAAAEAAEQSPPSSAEVFTTFRMTEPATREQLAAAPVAAPTQPVSAMMYVGAGLFSALTAAFELPALSFTVGIFVLLLLRDCSRALKYFLPPALVVAGLFFLTNYLALGRLVPAYAEADGQSPWYRYEGSHWLNPARRGIDFANEDKLTYSVHFLVGHHGVFALSPIFLFSLVGIGVILWKSRKSTEATSPPGSLPVLAGLTLYLTVVVIGFYIWKTNNYGGFSSGPRWLMWLTPFWLLTLLPVADKLSRCPWGRLLALFFLFVSVVSASYATWNPWQHPWIYRYVEGLGWMKY